MHPYSWMRLSWFQTWMWSNWIWSFKSVTHHSFNLEKYNSGQRSLLHVTPFGAGKHHPQNIQFLVLPTGKKKNHHKQSEINKQESETQIKGLSVKSVPNAHYWEEVAGKTMLILLCLLAHSMWLICGYTLLTRLLNLWWHIQDARWH